MELLTPDKKELIMTPAERKRFDAKIAAKNKAEDIAAKKKKYLTKQNKTKERSQKEEGKAYGRSRGKVQEAIREKQKEGLDYKGKKALREKLGKRESYGPMESGTYRTFGEVTKGVDVTPKTTYSKGDKPVKKFAPTKKSNTSSGEELMKAQKYNMGGMAAQAPMSDDKDMSMLRKKKKRPPMGMPTMKKGGKVRGCGMATQGNRKAKMVTMKGA